MYKTLISLFGIFAFGAATLLAGPASDFKDLYKAKDYPEAVKLIEQATAEKSKDEDIFTMAGDVYFELAMTEKALEMYKKAYDLDSKDNNIRRKYAKLLSETGKVNEAIELLNKAISSDKKDVKNYLALGQAYIKAGEMSKADLEIRKAQKMDEKLPEGWIALADLYFAQGVYSLAIDYYKKALELEETNIDARINLATSYYYTARAEEDKELKNGYYSQCLSEWEIVANKDPKNAKAFWEAGKIYYYSELWENAAKYLNKYIQLRPDHSLARFYLVQSLYEIEQCEALQENVDIVANEIDSVKTLVRNWQAECFYKQQKYSEAITAYKNLSATMVLNAEQLENIAKAYMFSGDTVQAIAAYRDVIKVDKSRGNTLMAFGTMAFQMKDYATAAEFLEVRDQNVKDELTDKMKYYLALSYLFNNDSLKAAETFEKVIQVDPTNYSASVYLSDAYVKLGKKAESITLLNDVIAKMSSDVKANENTLNNAFQKLCSSALQEKNFKEIGRIAKQWTDLIPNSQPGFFFYGLSFHGAGEVDGACKYYKRAVAIDPSTELAKSAKKYISDLKCN